MCVCECVCIQCMCVLSFGTKQRNLTFGNLVVYVSIYVNCCRAKKRESFDFFSVLKKGLIPETYM